MGFSFGKGLLNLDNNYIKVVNSIKKTRVKNIFNEKHLMVKNLK